MARYELGIPAADRRLLGQAAQIAGHFNENPPANVLAIQQLFEANSVWFVLGRNDPVTGCEDAANRRQCLGNEGIPLSRELKSYLGYYVDEAGRKQKVAVHCRAHHRIDFAKIRRALQINTDLERLVGDSSDEDGIYGLVNPFGLELASQREEDCIIQLFDELLFTRDELPHTLMTNAGDRTWSIEFRAEDLPGLLSAGRFSRADVVEKASPFHRPTIGLLTGNSPESGTLLWDAILKRVRTLRKAQPGKLTGDVYLPKIYVRSVPAMGMTMDLHLRRAQIWAEIGPEIEAMCKSLATDDPTKCNILTIACNTTPHFSPEIREVAERHNVRFLSIAEAVEDFLRSNAIREFTLLGIGYIHRPKFSGYARLFHCGDFDIHMINELALKEIEDLAYDVKEDEPIHTCSQKLNSILKRHDMRRENVVIALTELSLIVVRTKWEVGKPVEDKLGNRRLIIDAVQVYGDYVGDLFMGARDIDTLQPVPSDIAV